MQICYKFEIIFADGSANELKNCNLQSDPEQIG